MHSTNYIIRFVVILTTIVALILSLMSTGLADIHHKNEAIYNKKAILSAIASNLDVDFKHITDKQVEEIFANQIKQEVFDASGKVLSKDEVEAMGYKGGLAENVDMGKELKKPSKDQIHPMYVYTNKKGEKSYIVAIRGKGLWDEIWANVALGSDKNTITGISFDHKGETPGLGAEIKDNPDFSAQFNGRKILENGEYVSIKVTKGKSGESEHYVDGISGATITGNGVSKMLYEGINFYEPYLNTLKK